jgi:serine/threonine protein phosphatase PrpC
MSGVLAAAATSAGNVHERNEDSYLALPDEGLFAVADGMGGHSAGDIASGLAIAVVRERWRSRAARAALARFAAQADADSKRGALAEVRGGALAAHRAIRDRAAAEAACAGMGTTFTGFAIAGGHAVFAHTGDSRAYLVRDRIAIQLTDDHTVSARLRAAGVEPRPGAADPRRSSAALTAALGLGDGSRLATFLLPLFHGDRLLLCTDGVHESSSEAEIGEVVTSQPSPALAARKLVDLALSRGGRDNATAVAIRVLEAAAAQRPPDELQRDDAIMSASDLLGPLTAPERLRTLRITTPRDYRQGDELPAVALGERVCYFLLDGAVELASGEQRRAGDLVFPRALIEGGGGLAPARALTSIRVLVFRRDDFLELVADDVDLGAKLYDALGRLVTFGG